MRSLFAAACTLLLAACATAPDTHGSRSRLVYIASQKAPCGTGVMKTACLQYREEPTQPWQLNYAPIEGFDWQPGNEYLLKITEVEVKNPPQDASRIRWHVDKVVEQHPVP